MGKKAHADSGLIHCGWHRDGCSVSGRAACFGEGRSLFMVIPSWHTSPSGIACSASSESLQGQCSWCVPCCCKQPSRQEVLVLTGQVSAVDLSKKYPGDKTKSGMCVAGWAETTGDTETRFAELSGGWCLNPTLVRNEGNLKLVWIRADSQLILNAQSLTGHTRSLCRAEGSLELQMCEYATKGPPCLYRISAPSQQWNHRWLLQQPVWPTSSHGNLKFTCGCAWVCGLWRTVPSCS